MVPVIDLSDRKYQEVTIGIDPGSRKEYGSTVSMGIPRGTLIRHPKFGLTHIGGTSKGRISLHCLEGKRLTQSAKKEDIQILSINKWRTQSLPALKGRVSLRKL